MRGDAVELLTDLKPEERKLAVEALARERHPIVAFGSNAAPVTLKRKFAHFSDEVDRTVLVLAGELHGFDVGAAASLVRTDSVGDEAARYRFDAEASDPSSSATGG